MKKVLALVLAAIMVCTMAFAVSIGDTTTTTTTGDYKQLMQIVTPGESIKLNATDLDLVDDYGKDANGNFDPAKNTVSVKFTGSVASQGWVKDGSDYVYVLTTAANDSAVLDEKADLIINSITVSIVGKAGSKTYTYTKDFGGVVKYVAATPLAGYVATTEVTEDDLAMTAASTATPLAMAFDIGRNSTETSIAADGAITLVTPATVLYTVKAANGKTNGTYKITDSNGMSSNAKQVIASAKLNAGDKVYFTEISLYSDLASAAKNAVSNNIATNNATIIGALGYVTTQAKVLNVPMTITCDDAPDGAKMYMINKDGSLTDLNATFDANKVLTANAKITGIVIVSNKPLTATTASTGSTGTTTNPETGANDVIGVAAALAVVALVSGAAISLKK